MRPDPRTLGEVAHTELRRQLHQEPCFESLEPYAKVAWERAVNEAIRAHEERKKEATR